ncbi:LysE family translocator [Microbulbifer sp. A4B17]|uniref:LysE family translocator n=1 Tax=Microbulbifer sp. A4B17 TaxID=359370 RepID=UPI000D52D071|nr:LysE family translocator [Microbulbifer sp. A4B17]AWF80939.1 LysE family translocator [Microbulbifer sp. A4B17]
MIDLSILPAFLIAATILAISPGPDLLLISAYSSARGSTAGIMISLGIFTAGMLQTALVTLGLGHIMQTMPLVALAIKLIGATYLAWLGIALLRGWFLNKTTPSSLPDTLALSAKQLIFRGLLNNLMNPKALLFFSLFLPQFTVSTQAITPQILILGSLLSITALAFNTLISISFSMLGRSLTTRANVHRHLDGFLGITFLGLATRLAVDR